MCAEAVEKRDLLAKRRELIRCREPDSEWRLRLNWHPFWVPSVPKKKLMEELRKAGFAGLRFNTNIDDRLMKVIAPEEEAAKVKAAKKAAKKAVGKAEIAVLKVSMVERRGAKLDV